MTGRRDREPTAAGAVRRETLGICRCCFIESASLQTPPASKRQRDAGAPEALGQTPRLIEREGLQYRSRDGTRESGKIEVLSL